MGARNDDGRTKRRLILWYDLLVSPQQPPKLPSFVASFRESIDAVRRRVFFDPKSGKYYSRSECGDLLWARGPALHQFLKFEFGFLPVTSYRYVS